MSSASSVSRFTNELRLNGRLLSGLDSDAVFSRFCESARRSALVTPTRESVSSFAKIDLT